MLRERQRKLPSLQFNEPVKREYIYAFYFLQLADVWTTNEGMKYDCVYESNPLLPSIPHLDRLLIHKGFFLQPFHQLDSMNRIRNEDMIFPLIFSAYIVNNNLRVIDQAQRSCGLR